MPSASRERGLPPRIAAATRSKAPSGPLRQNSSAAVTGARRGELARRRA